MFRNLFKRERNEKEKRNESSRAMGLVIEKRNARERKREKKTFRVPPATDSQYSMWYE